MRQELHLNEQNRQWSNRVWIGHKPTKRKRLRVKCTYMEGLSCTGCKRCEISWLRRKQQVSTTMALSLTRNETPTKLWPPLRCKTIILFRPAPTRLKQGLWGARTITRSRYRSTLLLKFFRKVTCIIDQLWAPSHKWFSDAKQTQTFHPSSEAAKALTKVIGTGTPKFLLESD